MLHHVCFDPDHRICILISITRKILLPSTSYSPVGMAFRYEKFSVLVTPPRKLLLSAHIMESSIAPTPNTQASESDTKLLSSPYPL